MDTVKDLFNEEVMTSIIRLVSVIIIAIIGFATTRLIDKVTEKINDNIELNDSAKIRDFLYETVLHCVNETNQTFVNELKKKGIFDKEKQTEALERTVENVIIYLTDFCNGLGLDITIERDEIITLIESTIYSLKNN